ncbi:MAG: dicarboxylate/amino acid:cation symporter [Kiritimatiellae bacterium]|nr:dicarboxylate/amino acid:cation symporter [Kiritimatiellia bacterium]
MNLIKAYLKVSLVKRVVAGLVLGALCGGGMWWLSVSCGMQEGVRAVMRYCSPFGTVFVGMLKMIVVPTIFFSLVCGASSLPLKKLGKVGGKIILWYFASMTVSSVLGIAMACAVNPGAGDSLAGWQELARQFGADTTVDSVSAAPKALADVLEKLLSDIFQNPFAALADGNFLGVIAFAILFGVSLRLVLDAAEGTVKQARIQVVIDLCEACMAAVNKIIDFVMNYSPIGVFFLSMGIFSVYGPAIIGPYVSVVLGISAGIIILLFVAYPVMIVIVARQNPYRVIMAVREAMMLAFVTRSSAATLPVSIRVSEENLGINPELASFSLPLGATVNMDGVCVHLPMFAVLAANMFGIRLGIGDLALMMVTTVLAAVGAGGVPGSSLMLLFIILGALGLNPAQTAVIVALALGINPILDMFETMCNVTGDILCTYGVAKLENLAEGEVRM